MGEFSHASKSDLCLGAAVAAELRRKYPALTPKYVVGDLGCTLKAAENLLNGHLSSVMMGHLIAAYGPGWVAERVLEAAGQSLESYIEKQADDLEREAAKAKAKAHEARERLERFKAARRGHVELAGDDPDQRL